MLSLSVCYHARLHNREEYEMMVVNHFTGVIGLPGGPQQFRDEIRWYDKNKLYVEVFFIVNICSGVKKCYWTACN